jgi:hypothetical protein
MLRVVVRPPFIPRRTKSAASTTVEAIDVAARHLVYKLYEATNGQPGAWQVVGKIGERPATVARAVQRGWVVVRDDGVGKGKVRSASLTGEGRLLARKGR